MVATINADTTNGVIITSDTSGEIELQANGVTKAKITANGLQDANGASLRGGSFRNLIINGDQSVAQRGTSTASITTGGYYTVDRYSLTLSSLGIWTMSQDNDVPTGQGFAKSLKLACTTADASPASGDLLVIQHKIEAQNLQHLAYGTSSAKTLTMSFWVKSNKTGTYNLHIYQNDDARQFSNSYTITSANTWEKKILTIPADTTGVIDNNNGIGLQIEWVLGAGIDFTAGTNATTWQTYNTNDTAPSNVNLADSTSNYINITGVQLEVGSGASDFEFLPYDVQLARCQRYFYKALVACVANGSNGTIPNRPYPNTLRTAGSFSISYGGVANRVYRTVDAGLRDLVGPVMNGDVNSFHTLYAFTPTNWALSAGGINFDLEVNAEL